MFEWRRKSQTTAKHRIQHIILSGFGSNRFDTAVDKLQALDDLFMREVGERDFQGMNIGSDNGQTTIEVMNWMFSSAEQVPGSQHVPFSKDEDPYGDMEKARGMNLIRTEDNVVDYFTAGGNDTKWVFHFNENRYTLMSLKLVSQEPDQEVY